MDKQQIRFYDNGGRTFDRYTVVYMNERERNGLYGARGMSEDPFHPQGFGQYCTAAPGRHLGKRIHFEDLPEKCQRLIKQDLAAMGRWRVIGKPPFITDFGASIPLTVVEGEALPLTHIPRYGVWRWDGRRYECSATSDNLEELRRHYGVPMDRVLKIDTSKLIAEG